MTPVPGSNVSGPRPLYLDRPAVPPGGNARGATDAADNAGLATSLLHTAALTTWTAPTILQFSMENRRLLAATADRAATLLELGPVLYTTGALVRRLEAPVKSRALAQALARRTDVFAVPSPNRRTRWGHIRFRTYLLHRLGDDPRLGLWEEKVEHRAGGATGRPAG
ncbi:MAG: hypothetical protein ACYDDF_12495 [Thermoplasmatota archaeon]